VLSCVHVAAWEGDERQGNRACLGDGAALFLLPCENPHCGAVVTWSGRVSPKLLRALPFPLSHGSLREKRRCTESKWSFWSASMRCCCPSYSHWHDTKRVVSDMTARLLANAWVALKQKSETGCGAYLSTNALSVCFPSPIICATACNVASDSRSLVGVIFIVPRYSNLPATGRRLLRLARNNRDIPTGPLIGPIALSSAPGGQRCLTLVGPRCRRWFDVDS
jgi:hypothetical protein